MSRTSTDLGLRMRHDRRPSLVKVAFPWVPPDLALGAILGMLAGRLFSEQVAASGPLEDRDAVVGAAAYAAAQEDLRRRLSDQEATLFKNWYLQPVVAKPILRPPNYFI